MNKIIAKFDSFADVDVMKKLTRWLSQNTNESIHHRLFSIISKTKSFNYNHIHFAAAITTIIHNIGYEYALGMLYQHVGAFSMRERKLFQYLDSERKRNALEAHQKKKKESAWKNKPDLKRISEDIHYSPGYGFEEYEVQSIQEFERQQEVREELEQEFNAEDPAETNADIRSFLDE